MKGRKILVFVLSLVLLVSSEVELLDDSNFDERLESDKMNWWVNFHSSFCGTPCEDFTTILAQLDESLQGRLHVGTVDHLQNIIQRFDVQGFPTSIYIRHNPKEQKRQFYVYSGNRSVEAITLFAAGDFRLSVAYDLPVPIKVTSLVVKLNDTSFDKRVMRRYGAYWAVLFCDKEEFECASVRPHFEGLAKLLRGKINHGLVDKSVGDKTFTRFGISKVPSLWVFRGGKRYAFTKESFNTEDMQAFIEGGYEKGNEGIKVELQPEAEEQIGDVIILNDLNFDVETKAMSPSSQATWFVKFYAPWCGHCKAMAPIWESVASILKHKVHVAKLDCIKNKNTSERFGIPGFPTLLLFKQGKYFKYDGKLKTAEALLEWVVRGYQKNEEGETMEGMPVPPPIGQPIPPPTWSDLMYTSKEDFLGLIQYNRPQILFIFGSGSVIGGGMVMYAFIILILIRFAGSQASTNVPSSKALKYKKGK